MVQPGDTLSAVAAKFNETDQELIDLNSGGPPWSISTALWAWWRERGDGIHHGASHQATPRECSCHGPRPPADVSRRPPRPPLRLQTTWMAATPCPTPACTSAPLAGECEGRQQQVVGRRGTNQGSCHAKHEHC